LVIVAPTRGSVGRLASPVARAVRSLLPRRRIPALRTVDVLPPSSADEVMWVFLTAAFIVLVVMYVVAFQTYDAGRSDASRVARSLLPFQVLFRDLPGPEQRVFRAMQEGVSEAVRLRSETGVWPSVATLSAAGVPPFAPDVLDKAGLRWDIRQ